MKAVRKSDGEIIDVVLLHDREYIDLEMNEDGTRRIYDQYGLIVDGLIDWDRFRAEAAKDILCSILTGGANQTDDNNNVFRTTEQIVDYAVCAAEVLIKRLKGETE